MTAPAAPDVSIAKPNMPVLKMAPSPPRTEDLRQKKVRLAQPGVAQIAPPTPVTDPAKWGMPTVGAPITDPNKLSGTITKENTLRNKRLGFGVKAPQVNLGGGGAGNVSAERISSRDTVGSIKDAFQAQLPQMMQEFRDQVEGLTSRTAAMGRTGSGMFNEETGFIGDRALAAREALLGNLSFTATQNDANRALQAAQANQGAALQAGLGNQSAGLQARGIDANIAQANANRALQVDLARQSHLGQLQAREDRLAREAMMDRQFQMGLLQQGFSGAPTGAVGMGVNAANAAAQQYGSNAGQINAQLANSGMQQGMMTPQASQSSGGGFLDAAISGISGLLGGGGGAPQVIERTQPFSTRGPSIGRPITAPPLML